MYYGLPRVLVAGEWFLRSPGALYLFRRRGAAEIVNSADGLFVPAVRISCPVRLDSEERLHVLVMVLGAVSGMRPEIIFFGFTGGMCFKGQVYWMVCVNALLLEIEVCPADLCHFFRLLYLNQVDVMDFGGESLCSVILLWFRGLVDEMASRSGGSIRQ
nr:hypothetical protein Iba_scaffold18705CG0010 [Ipomoea batatas]GME17411.1 hypothetical protein Iba_scaffold18706CG0010 [Ipomoea batatas]